MLKLYIVNAIDNSGMIVYQMAYDSADLAVKVMEYERERLEQFTDQPIQWSVYETFLEPKFSEACEAALYAIKLVKHNEFKKQIESNHYVANMGCANA